MPQTARCGSTGSGAFRAIGNMSLSAARAAVRLRRLSAGSRRPVVPRRGRDDYDSAMLLSARGSTAGAASPADARSLAARSPVLGDRGVRVPPSGPPRDVPSADRGPVRLARPLVRARLGHGGAGAPHGRGHRDVAPGREVSAIIAAWDPAGRGRRRWWDAWPSCPRHAARRPPHLASTLRGATPSRARLRRRLSPGRLCGRRRSPRAPAKSSGRCPVIAGAHGSTAPPRRHGNDVRDHG